MQSDKAAFLRDRLKFIPRIVNVQRIGSLVLIPPEFLDKEVFETVAFQEFLDLFLVNCHMIYLIRLERTTNGRKY